jgi:hypothetical protein
VLIWSGFSSVACTLISYGLVVGKHPQNALVRPLMHTSRFDRHGAVCAPLEPSAQLLDTTRRAVPPMAHCRLVYNAALHSADQYHIHPQGEQARLQRASLSRPAGAHETLLLDNGVPVHVVAARCGHDPATLLRSYAKRTRKADTSAAGVIGSISKGILGS